MKYIVTNTVIPKEGLDELFELTGWQPQIITTEQKIQTKWNPYHKQTWGDFNWLRSLFPADATARCYVTTVEELKEAGITTHWGLYDVVDSDSVHDFYFGLPNNLSKRAKDNGFKTNFAWLFVHELLHGKEKFASQPDRVHTMEEQGRLKELLEEYLTNIPEAVNIPEVVITHHALSKPEHTVDDVNEWHKERWPNFVSRLGYHVGYHYVIHNDGTIVQTRHHDEEGAHTLGMNKRSIGVCFMGNFDVDMPSEAQNDAWTRLYTKLDGMYQSIPTAPHRAFSVRTCHGTNLSDNYFQLVHQRYGLLLKTKMLLSKLLSRLLGRN